MYGMRRLCAQVFEVSYSHSLASLSGGKNSWCDTPAGVPRAETRALSSTYSEFVAQNPVCNMGNKSNIPNKKCAMVMAFWIGLVMSAILASCLTVAQGIHLTAQNYSKPNVRHRRG